MENINYDTDFYAWTQKQAYLLRNKEIYQIDWENIAEEIEGMGRSEKRQLESRLEVLIMHLLKWQFQPNLRSRYLSLSIVRNTLFYVFARLRLMVQSLETQQLSMDDKVK